MHIYLSYIVIVLFPALYCAQGKKTESTPERLEIVGKWNSYTSEDSTKNQVVEFLPDGSFIEYTGNTPKHSKAKYVLYKNKLSIVENGKEAFSLKFEVSKTSYGLFLRALGVNNKMADKFVWVKLFPWKS